MENWLDAIIAVRLEINREQARSHMIFGEHNIRERQRTCGSELARDEGSPVSRDFRIYFCVPSSCCRFACVRLAPAGTLRVSQTLPPMVEPLPMVIRPRIVAPA